MKKGEIVELVQRSLKGEIHYNVVSAYIETVYDTAVQEEANRANMHGYFASDYSATIADGEIELPVNLIRLARPGSGVMKLVAPTEEVEFKPIPVGSVNFISNLRAGEGLGVFVWYSVLGNKIKLLSPYDGSASVVVTAIPKFSSYEIKDEVYIPEGFSDKLIDAARAHFDGAPTVNNANDNIDKNE